MGEKHTTITDNSPGAKHIIGHAYVDDNTGDVTFTDNSAGYKNITGYGHVDENSSKSNNAGNSGAEKDDPFTVPKMILCILVLFCLFAAFSPLGFDNTVMIAFYLIVGIVVVHFIRKRKKK